MTKKRANRTALPAKRVTEYRFMIDAYTPATIPMARLAEYMSHLAEILGEATSVHFDRLEPGSTQIVSRIEREAVPKVRQNTAAVRRGDAPRDAMRAFKSLDELLRNDNATGRLTEGRRTVVLAFPGRETRGESFPSVRQHGSIEGEVIRVGGAKEHARVLVELDKERVVSCWATRSVAKGIAARLFEYVRLHGEGRWSRSVDGVWALDDFHVTSHEVLDRAPLGEALGRVRAAGTGWVQEAYDNQEVARHGPGGGRHGSH